MGKFCLVVEGLPPTGLQRPVLLLSPPFRHVLERLYTGQRWTLHLFNHINRAEQFQTTISPPILGQFCCFYPKRLPHPPSPHSFSVQTCVTPCHSTLSLGRHWTALHCTELHCTALYCTVLHYPALYCTALYCPALDSSPIVSWRILP